MRNKPRARTRVHMCIHLCSKEIYESICACELFGFACLCVCFREGVSLGPSGFSLSPPLGQLTRQVFSCKEELVQFWALIWKLVSEFPLVS